MRNLREDETVMEDGQRTTKTHVPKSNHSTATANKSHEKNRACALPRKQLDSGNVGFGGPLSVLHFCLILSQVRHRFLLLFLGNSPQLLAFLSHPLSFTSKNGQ